MGRLLARATAMALLVALPAAAPLRTAAWPPSAAFEEPGEGRDEAVPGTHRPTVVAAFARESYRPGQPARLVITDHAPTSRCSSSAPAPTPGGSAPAT